MHRRIRALVAAPHRFHKKDPFAAVKEDVISKIHSRLESLKSLVRGATVPKRKQRRCLPPAPLPVELWMKIVEEHSSRNEWIALSQTCRFFQRVAQPCLYKRAIVGRYFSPEEMHGSMWTSLSYFSRTIDRRPDLGEIARELTIHSPSRAISGEDDVLYLTPRTLFWYTDFPNLEKIHVSKYWLTPEFCVAINSLPRLRVAKYEHCRVDGNLLAAYLQHYPNGSLHEVEITIPYIFKASSFPNAWTCVVPTGILSLKLQTPGNPLYLDLMMSSIMIMGSNAMLTTLSIGTSYPPERETTSSFPPTLIPFLMSSPQLRHLEIDCWTSDPSLLEHLPSDALPLLEDYSGPPAFFDIFLRGRPVRRVGSIFDLSMARSVPADCLLPLCLSSAPVTELALDIGIFPSQNDVGECLLHAPITIRRLEWKCVFATDLIRWLPALSRLKDLQEIHGLKDYKLKQEEVACISEGCPSLREIYTDRHVWVPGNRHFWETFLIEEDVR